MVKNLSAMQENRVRSLGQDDPLEEEMVTHSSTLAWRIPWTKEPGGLRAWSHKQSDTTEGLTLNIGIVLFQSPTCVLLFACMGCSKPDFSVPHHLLECAQVHVQ